MMIRNIRKAISVICVIAMLLSLCVLAFMGSTSATVSQADTSVDTWDTVLELDFNNEKGITLIAGIQIKLKEMFEITFQFW